MSRQKTASAYGGNGITVLPRFILQFCAQSSASSVTPITSAANSTEHVKPIRKNLFLKGAASVERPDSHGLGFRPESKHRKGAYVEERRFSAAYERTIPWALAPERNECSRALRSLPDNF